MTSPAPLPRDMPARELLADRARLNTIKNVMHTIIHKTLFPTGADRSAQVERVIASGVSVDDVLGDALLELLRCEKKDGSWEGLAATIAHRRAVAALRKNVKGRTVEGREISVVRTGALDAEPDELIGSPDHAPAPDDVLYDAEKAFSDARRSQILVELAHAVLGDVERQVFFAIEFNGEKRTVVGPRHGKTAQWAGQIWKKARARVVEAALAHPELQPDNPNQGGPDE